MLHANTFSQVKLAMTILQVAICWFILVQLSCFLPALFHSLHTIAKSVQAKSMQLEALLVPCFLGISIWQIFMLATPSGPERSARQPVYLCLHPAIQGSLSMTHCTAS